MIHHLSSRQRRVEAIKEIVRCLKRPSSPRREGGDTAQSGKEEKGSQGQALIFAWALEQKGSRRGWDKGGEQDVLVPWVLKAGAGSAKGSKQRKQGLKKQQRGAEQEHQPALEAGMDSDRSLHQVSTSDSEGCRPTAPDGGEQTAREKSMQSEQGKTFHRFYHLYAEGELQSEAVEAGAKVVEEGYDRDNWWVVIEPG